MEARLWSLVATGLWLVLLEVSCSSFMDGKKCYLAHYGSLDPQVLRDVKDLQNRYEMEMQGWEMRNCSSRLFQLPRRAKSLTACGRLLLLERELAHAQAVLRNLSGLDLGRNATRPLQLLAAICEDLASCVPPSARQREMSWEGHRARRQLRSKAKAKKEVTPRCLEAAVVLNLFRLLTRDLRQATYLKPCDRAVSLSSAASVSPVRLHPPVPRLHPGPSRATPSLAKRASDQLPLAPLVPRRGQSESRSRRSLSDWPRGDPPVRPE